MTGGGADLVELPPSVDPEEVTDAVAAEPPELPSPSPAGAPARRAGVRTRRKRATAATLPPLTLGVDPSWQPAGLFSWSEVLHEAQMQPAHRGLEDRLQAWLLAELIRYLEHPRSGAAGFDDMGAAWVPVRDAVVANTLRATDREVGAVTTSWEKLVRHLGLTMTSQLGVAVTPVLPRRLARDHAARAQAAAAELATSRTLSATLRIPGAAGPVTVVADLRTAHIRTSVVVDAPREGGGPRRVDWMLRQLAGAPDALTVEVLFARREQTSCEQLRDVRGNPGALLPDPGTEVRGFRLTCAVPMGARRNGTRKAFVPSVHDAVEAFYARVVQGLRPSPPKMPADAAAAADAIDAVDRAVDGVAAALPG